MTCAQRWTQQIKQTDQEHSVLREWAACSHTSCDDTGNRSVKNSVPMPLAIVPIQLDRLQARSEKKSSKPLDSSSTFLNIAIISKLITIIRACFPLRKIRSVKRRERLYGGGRKERRVFNIYMLRSLHILFYWVLTTNPHHRYNYFHFGEKEMETLV